jgi:hypothetical protein
MTVRGGSSVRARGWHALAVPGATRPSTKLTVSQTVTAQRGVVVLTWADILALLWRTLDHPAHIPRAVRIIV